MSAVAVDVAGVGMHPFGRFDGVSTTDMGVVAVRAALREAGVGKGGFQAAFCGTAYGGVATGHKVLSRLGMTGLPIVDVEAGCASGGAALMLAAAATEWRLGIDAEQKALEDVASPLSGEQAVGNQCAKEVPERRRSFNCWDSVEN